MEIRSVLRHVALPQEELLGTPEVCVAVLDGPVDLSHPCFEGADLTQIDTLVQEPAGQGPMSLHGTHVASLLFAQPGKGSVTGMVPRCRGLLLPVFHDLNPERVPQVDLARAIDRAVQEGAHIINISGGERTPDGQADHLLAHALRRCDELGVLVVAAVGNDGCDCLQVPAAVPSVVSVGATSSDGEPFDFNNWGAAYRHNGVLAPGENVEGAAPGGGSRQMTGSSFATPAVTGVAGLLVTEQLRTGRELNPKAAGQTILQTAIRPECWPDDAAECRRYLGGHLHAGRAYESIAARHMPAPRERAAGEDGLAPVGMPQERPVPAAMGVRPSQGETTTDTSKKVTSMDTTGPPTMPSEGCGNPRQVASPFPQSETPVQDGARPSCTCGGCGGNATPHAATASVRPAQPELEDDAADVIDAREQAPVPAAIEPSSHSGAVSQAVPAASVTAVESSTPAAGIRPACSPGQYGSRPLVYVIGTVNYDFGTEARRDSFRQEMPEVEVPGPDGPHVYPPNVYDPGQMRDFLSENPDMCNRLHWTVEIDRMPVYALVPEPSGGMDWGGPVPAPEDETDTAYRSPRTMGSHVSPPSLSDHWYPPVSRVYKLLRDAVWGQSRPRDKIDEYVSRVSIPGVLTDRTVRLFNGPVVPVVQVQSHGLAMWNESLLVEEVTNEVSADSEQRKVRVDAEELKKTIRALLDKLYNEFRNLGQSSADRALNYAGTNAFQFGTDMMQGILSAKHVPGPEDRLYTLDRVTVSKSPFSRPNSDCQDVYITFMDPENDRRARVTYVYTLDVSEVPGVSLVPTRVFLGDL
ncbi:S8 family serine peptidase [Streptomyces sp. enrichment culture]|uniref:S8 family serine peptidase n=1 Tax=Streptomyces sp. enrichment culture TaxID=1795815 RepID=UPI003F54D1DA